MTTTKSVLGVLGMCWVDFGKPTHVEAPKIAAFGSAVLGVLGLCARARVRESLKVFDLLGNNSYARTEKPNTPNTLYTPPINQLISLSFDCVGFVSGLPYVCWVQNSGGSR